MKYPQAHAAALRVIEQVRTGFAEGGEAATRAAALGKDVARHMGRMGETDLRSGVVEHTLDTLAARHSGKNWEKPFRQSFDRLLTALENQPHPEN